MTVVPTPKIDPDVCVQPLKERKPHTPNSASPMTLFHSGVPVLENLTTNPSDSGCAGKTIGDPILPQDVAPPSGIVTPAEREGSFPSAAAEKTPDARIFPFPSKAVYPRSPEAFFETTRGLPVASRTTNALSLALGTGFSQILVAAGQAGVVRTNKAMRVIRRFRTDANIGVSVTLVMSPVNVVESQEKLPENALEPTEAPITDSARGGSANLEHKRRPSSRIRLRESGGRRLEAPAQFSDQGNLSKN